ncbi:DUF3291 domain-containing protein [Aurantivibrio plasticivorans]
MEKYQLAQMNIAQAKASLDSEIMKDFVARIEEINHLAETSPGFVWRFDPDPSDDTNVRVFNNSSLVVNMSVWEDIESLKHYVYRTAHIELIQDRDTWFNKIQSAHQVLWWVTEGCVPTPEEGKARMDHLTSCGPSPYAFTFSKPFSAEKHA